MTGGARNLELSPAPPITVAAPRGGWEGPSGPLPAPIPTRRLTALGRTSPLAPNAKIRHEAPTILKGARAMTRLDVDVFAQAGELLVGRDWQRALARILAPYHPSGTKTNSFDDSLVRK